jgi:6-pyruvoyltetrahydropterin/6-carboxytetrahydropterin synthase
MFELTIETSFSAAHRLREHPGRCANLHGHNYRVLVAVRAEELNAQGMVMDFADLKAVCFEVVDPLDHAMLNDLPAFAEQSPTAERLAQYLFESLAPRLEKKSGGQVALAYVTVCESERSCATYRR